MSPHRSGRANAGGPGVRLTAHMCWPAAYDSVRRREVCKTVGSAYVGSNPTPATTSENGPHAAETRPGGPFPSRHDVYQCVTTGDAWQCVRTYGVQRPGKTSGSCNRSLWRPAPFVPYV